MDPRFSLVLNCLPSTNSKEHEERTAPSLGEFAGLSDKVLNLSLLIYKASAFEHCLFCSPTLGVIGM